MPALGQAQALQTGFWVMLGAPALRAVQALGQMQAGTYLPYVADPQLCYTSKLWD